MESKRKAAILIISDKASEDPTLDRTAGALTPILAREGKWEPAAIRIVPNNIPQIQQAVCDWSDGSHWYDLVLLSSTTGFGVKDNTPEVRGFVGI
jgi:gephyrin